MNWKFLSIVSFILIIPVIVLWLIDSSDYGESLIFSRDKKPVVTKTKDELFGSETTETTWKEGFWLGLLPGDDSLSINIILGVLPISGFFLAAGLVSAFIHYRKNIKSKSN